MVGRRGTKRAGPWIPSSSAATLPAEPLSHGKTDIDPNLGAKADRQAATGIAEGHILRDRYRILDRIGSGGMGDVWRAEHVVIGRPLAIKVLGSHASGRRQAEALMREARAIAALRHPNIVDITDFGYAPDGAPYLVMELLQGRTLKQVIATEGRFSWPRARSVLLQLTDALAHVHGQGIIHRDLKPGNVFVLGEPGCEVCKIIDFGIAKLTVLDADAKEFTRTDMVFGTPAFMGPEQARGQPVDHRADVYALGCVAYQMLTARHPFTGSTPTEVLYKQLFEHPERMSVVTPDADVTPEIEAVVMMAMRKTPDLRFSDMTEMRAAIEAVGTGAPSIVVPEERLPTPSRRAATRFATSAAAAPFPVGQTPKPAPPPPLPVAAPVRHRAGHPILTGAAIAVGIAAAAAAGYLAVVTTDRGPTGEIQTTPQSPTAAGPQTAPPPSQAVGELPVVDAASETPEPAAGEEHPSPVVAGEPDAEQDVHSGEPAEKPPRAFRGGDEERPGQKRELPPKPDPVAPPSPGAEKKRTPKARPPARPDRKQIQDGDLVDPFAGSGSS